ncbi:inositol phosphate phosphatase SopB, partial [Salmonella enterica]
MLFINKIYAGVCVNYLIKNLSREVLNFDYHKRVVDENICQSV